MAQASDVSHRPLRLLLTTAVSVCSTMILMSSRSVRASRGAFVKQGLWGMPHSSHTGSRTPHKKGIEKLRFSVFHGINYRRDSFPWSSRSGVLASSRASPRLVARAPAMASPSDEHAEEGKRRGMLTVQDFAAQLEPFGVTGVGFGEDGEEDELAVCCPESRRLMDCTVDMYATVNSTNYCVALPIFSPVALCYHKGARLIPVENECELMDRLYDFLAPTLEQEDLFLIRSPVCLTLDGDLGDLGEEGEFSEEELAGWEEFESEDDPWQDGDEEQEEEEEDSMAGTFDDEVEKMTNPKYWDDEQASDVREAYGEDWEKIAAFTYDGVDYTMVKILEPVLVLAKEDPDFKGITKWVLPSEDEAEEIAPIMEGIIKIKLGIDDQDAEDEMRGVDDEEDRI